MKKIFFIIVLLQQIHLAGFAQTSALHYSIDGRVKGMPSGKIYFSVFGLSGKKDSAVIKDEVFHFKGTLAEPSPVILSLERNYVNKPLFLLFVGEGKHSVDLKKEDLNKGKVTGPPVTRDYVLLDQMIKPFNDKFESSYYLAKDTSEAGKAKWEKIRSSLMNDRQAAEASFIKAHPSSPVAAWALERNFSYDPLSADIFKQLFNSLSPSLNNTSSVVNMKEKLKIAERLTIGNEAPNFTQKDTSDKDISLTDFRGKYLFLDFWASWCVPCRAENPNVVKAFNEYKDKNFTVLSVSLDGPGKKNAWLAAIHKDGLAWTHVSDLKFWDNQVARQYGIQSVPSNLLLDPKGKIIAKNLYGEDLENKLKEIFKAIM